MKKLFISQPMKVVKIGDEVARIGDTVQFNGRRLSVERR